MAKVGTQGAVESTRARLPDPARLSVYTFASRYHAQNLPLWLALVAATLLLLHLILMRIYFSSLESGAEDRIKWYAVSVFDVDSEEGLGTYFSAVSLLFCGRLLWHHARAVQRLGQVWCVWWFLLAVLFHVLSIEEVVDLHELVGEAADRGGGDRYQAVANIGLSVGLLLGAALVPLLMHCGLRFSMFAVAGGLMYGFGSVCVDLWTPRPEDYDRTFSYHAWAALEEGLELFGPLLFLHGFLALIAQDPKGTVAVATQIEP